MNNTTIFTQSVDCPRYDGSKLHINGTPLEYPDGTITWYKNALRHREDGPAIEQADGYKAWYKNDELHRENGPAIEYVNGDKEWYINGQLHRIDGPAIERSNGDKKWYINGKRIDEPSTIDKIKIEEDELDGTNEIILNFEYLENQQISKDSTNDDGYVGYIITTDKQEIKVMIESETLCCEDHGLILYFEEQIPDETHMFCSSGFLQKFNEIQQDSNLLNSLIGLQIKRIAFSNQRARKEFCIGKIGGDTEYIDILLTDGRKVQLFAWNEHNDGSYEHNLYIKWNDREEVYQL